MSLEKEILKTETSKILKAHEYQYQRYHALKNDPKEIERKKLKSKRYREKKKNGEEINLCVRRHDIITPERDIINLDIKPIFTLKKRDESNLGYLKRFDSQLDTNLYLLVRLGLVKSDSNNFTEEYKNQGKKESR